MRVKLRGHRGLVTIVGHAATISAGEFVQASGAWINDRTHGRQLKAAFLRVAAPQRKQIGPSGQTRPLRYPRTRSTTGCLRLDP